VSTRRIIGLCLAALSVACISVSARAAEAEPGPVGAKLTRVAGVEPAATTKGAYVDGISDQSLPEWDGNFNESYFTGLFNDRWANGTGSHISFARYVVQWNLLSDRYSRYLAEFEAWLGDVSSIGLRPEIALTSYDGSLPGSQGEYGTGLTRILSRASALGHPIRWLEAWNEPNGQGDVSAARAAGFANAASEVCAREYGCTVIVGDFEDSPDVAEYEREYIDSLDPVPSNWGVHPYYSIEQESEAPYDDVREHLPNGGAGERIWFTEVAARRCSDFDGHLVENGEAGQAHRASWLVNTLIRNTNPEHVFYYEVLLKERRQPSCQAEGSDSALYLPNGNPAEPDRPRSAASYIWGGQGAPAGYGEAFMANAAQATLTGGVSL
jgi:hypothetical protein